MRTIIYVALASMLVASAFGSITAGAYTAGSGFNQTAPTQVFSNSNNTANTPNDVIIAGSGVNYMTLVYGAGLTNDTIYAWEAQVSASPYSLTGVVKRTINATVAAYGNGTTKEESVWVADATTAITAITVKAIPVAAAGVGYYAIGYVSSVTTTISGTGYIQDTLFLSSVSNTGTLNTNTVTAGTTYATSSPSSSYSFAVNQLWYEDGFFYILFEAQTLTSTTSTSVTGLYLQAYGAPNKTALFMASSVATPLALATWSGVTGPTVQSQTYATQTMAVGGNSNYTNSTYSLVVYKDTSPTAPLTKYVQVTRLAGTAGTATTVGTDQTANAGATYAVYTPGGVIGSNYTYGITVGSVTGASPYTYNLTAAYNTSLSTLGNFYVAPASPVAAPQLWAVTRYRTGFATIIRYATSTTTTPNTYQYQAYLYNANGTLVNGTSAVTIATLQGPLNAFVDVSGQVWVGYATIDVESGTPVTYPLTGYVARLLASVNTPTTMTSSGSIIAVFSALLSFVVVSLFMF